jgi:TonB-linked SusC/RagA family outer membrane protein
MKACIFIIVFTFGSCYAFAQDITFSGKVTDTSGNAISHALVIIKGDRKTGCATNHAGEFSLKIPSSVKSIMVLAMGFQPREIFVEGKSNTKIILYPETKKLGEVVVVAYGTQNKKDVTGAVSQLNSKDLRNIPTVTMDQALQGRVAGLNITQSGTPGGGSNINIRGVNSISSNSQPLFVIDGVLMDSQIQTSFVGGQGISPLTNINPNDIESYSVLKDAAATALYGSKAANGAIIITTKRGKNQKTQINFGATYGIQNIAKKLPSLNSQEYVKLVQEGTGNAGFSKPSATGFVGLDNDPGTYTSTTNWQDYIFKTAPVQNYDLSLSGGNENTKFRISGNYTNQDGIMIASGYKRYALRVNLDNRVTSKLSINTGINASYSDYKRQNGNMQPGALVNALLMSPAVNAYNADGSYGTDSNGGRLGIANPLPEAYDPLNKTGIADMMANITLNYAFSSSLSFKSVLGANYNNSRTDQFFPSTTSQGGYTKGYANVAGSGALNLSSENSLNYSKHFDLHALDITAGYSVNKRIANTFTNSSSNFPNDNFTSVSAGATKEYISSGRTQNGTIGMFARVNYIFNNKYEITGSVRRDGTSVFGADKRWGNFPSVSVGWKLLEENFLKGSSTINFLKIRASWGLTGNQDITNGTTNAAMNLYNTTNPNATNVSYLNSPGIGLSQLGNPDVGWEESEQQNIGVDAQFFKGIINITADYFIRNNRNVLLLRPLPGSTGFTNVYENIGALQNKGLELSIQSMNITHKNFSWNSAFNITFTQNKVKKLNIAPFRGDRIGFLRDADPSWIEEGYSLGSFKGYKVKGIFQSADEIAAAPTQSPETKPGDIQFEDINHDGVIDSEDQVILGKAVPDFLGGFTNRFRYKNVEATFLLNYSYGNKMYNATRQETESMRGSTNQTTGVLNRWTPSNRDTNVPRAVYGDPNQNNRISDRWLEDASYIRLKTVTLTYHLPVPLVRKLKLLAAECFISAENLLTLTKYTGYDPEVNAASMMENTLQGVDKYNVPLARIYRLGLNISF